MFEIDYDVGDSDLVERYDHVHHAHCLRLLELARLRYLEAIGFPNDALMDKGLFLVITSITIDYKREILRGPHRITCEEPLLDGKAVILRQRVINGRGKDAVTATVSSMFMSAETRRAIQTPDDFAAAFLRVQKS